MTVLFEYLCFRHITLFHSQNDMHTDWYIHSCIHGGLSVNKIVTIKSYTTSFRVNNLSFYFHNIFAQSSVFAIGVRLILFRCLIKYAYILNYYIL